MLSLDDEDDLRPGRPVAAMASSRPSRSFNMRPLLTGLIVAVLGGGLGVSAYWLSSTDTRDVIAMLDVGDMPRLVLPIPDKVSGIWAGDGERPEGGLLSGGLLRPPGGAAVPNLPPAMGEPPPLETVPPGHAAMPTHPAGPAQSAIAAPPAAPVPEAVAVPGQPMPRDPAQAPTYATLSSRLFNPKPLSSAPADGLIRQSAHGPLPMVAKDGRQPWRVYARPFDAPANKARLSVVVSNLGLDRDATDAAISKLPADVTLAFSPYAGNLEGWVKKARDAGHEVLLMLPAEAEGYPARDPGPWGLLSSNSVEDNSSRFEQVLGRMTGYVGVLVPDGRFITSPRLTPILGGLRERGLLYVGNGARTDAGPPVAAVTASVDAELFRDAIEARLIGAARAAKDSGQGVVVIEPKPVTFDRLVDWLDRLESNGVVLAPTSSVVKQTGRS